MLHSGGAYLVIAKQFIRIVYKNDIIQTVRMILPYDFEFISQSVESLFSEKMEGDK